MQTVLMVLGARAQKRGESLHDPCTISTIRVCSALRLSCARPLRRLHRLHCLVAGMNAPESPLTGRLTGVEAMTTACDCAPCLTLVSALDAHLAVIGQDGNRRVTRHAVRRASRAVDEAHGLDPQTQPPPSRARRTPGRSAATASATSSCLHQCAGEAISAQMPNNVGVFGPPVPTPGGTHTAMTRSWKTAPPICVHAAEFREKCHDG